MINLFITIWLTAHPACFADGHNQHRSMPAKHAFTKKNPCPGGPDKGLIYRCRGYVVDHICALQCCGLDEPINMQWQTSEEGKRKDTWESNCSTCNEKNQRR